MNLLNGKHFLYRAISLAQEPFFWLLANYILSVGLYLIKDKDHCHLEEKKKENAASGLMYLNTGCPVGGAV